MTSGLPQSLPLLRNDRWISASAGPLRNDDASVIASAARQSRFQLTLFQLQLLFAEAIRRCRKQHAVVGMPLSQDDAFGVASIHLKLMDCLAMCMSVDESAHTVFLHHIDHCLLIDVHDVVSQQ